MNRKEAIRTLGTAMALPMTGGAPSWDPATAARLTSARAALFDSPYAYRTLDRSQVRSVTVLVELIIPETDTPGANAVGVPEFVDVILTDWFNAAETARFLNGLEQLDADARAAHGADFAELPAEAQISMLEALDAELQVVLSVGSGRPSLDPVAAPVETPAAATDPSFHFMYQLKRLTLTGYFTSEAGMIGELDYQIIPGRYDGCADRV